MTDYRYIARQLLKDNRPTELKEMQSEGRLEPFLETIQRNSSETELEAIQRTMKGLPPEMPYQERVQAAETAKREIRELLIDGLQFLLSPEEEPGEPLSEEEARERLERVRSVQG